MVLASHGFVVPCPAPQLRCKPDPQTLNAYLQAHGGYHCDAGDCNNLVLTAPDELTGGRMRLIGEWCAALEPWNPRCALSSVFIQEIDGISRDAILH